MHAAASRRGHLETDWEVSLFLINRITKDQKRKIKGIQQFDNKSSIFSDTKYFRGLEIVIKFATREKGKSTSPFPYYANWAV